MSRQRYIYLFLVFAAICMIAWLDFVKGYATFAQKEFIAIYHLDKILHLIGGAFISGMIFVLRGRVSLSRLLLYVLIGAVVWECAEIILDSDVGLLYSQRYERWLVDTVLDITASVVGAIVYWLALLRSYQSPRLSEKAVVEQRKV